MASPSLFMLNGIHCWLQFTDVQVLLKVQNDTVATTQVPIWDVPELSEASRGPQLSVHTSLSPAHRPQQQEKVSALGPPLVTTPLTLVHPISHFCVQEVAARPFSRSMDVLVRRM